MDFPGRFRKKLETLAFSATSERYLNYLSRDAGRDFE